MLLWIYNSHFAHMGNEFFNWCNWMNISTFIEYWKLTRTIHHQMTIRVKWSTINLTANEINCNLNLKNIITTYHCSWPFVEEHNFLYLIYSDDKIICQFSNPNQFPMNGCQKQLDSFILILLAKMCKILWPEIFHKLLLMLTPCKM